MNFSSAGILRKLVTRGSNLGSIFKNILTQLNLRMTPGVKKRILREEPQKDRPIVHLI